MVIHFVFFDGRGSVQDAFEFGVAFTLAKRLEAELAPTEAFWTLECSLLKGHGAS